MLKIILTTCFSSYCAFENVSALASSTCTHMNRKLASEPPILPQNLSQLSCKPSLITACAFNEDLAAFKL